MARHVGFMLDLQKRGAITFDYGNNLREFARQGGEPDAFNFRDLHRPISVRCFVRVKGRSGG
jgi:urocanate hydratase